MADQHPLSSATHLIPRQDGRLDVVVDPAYGNLNGPHGGVTAATMLRSVLEHPDASGDPIALTVNFCAPIRIEAATVAPLLIRGGKATQHWYVQVEQGGIVVASATVVMGQRKPGWTHQAQPAPAAPKWDSILPLETGGRLPWLDRSSFDLSMALFR